MNPRASANSTPTNSLGPDTARSSRLTAIAADAADPLERDALAYAHSNLHRELLSSGLLPADLPIVKKLNAASSKLRQAILADPLMEYLGISKDTLSSQCQVVVFCSPLRDAFVIHGDSSVIYISTGMLRALDQNLSLPISILGHEQAHAVRDAILEKREAELTNSRAASMGNPQGVMAGALIWRDPYAAQVGKPLLEALKARVCSRPNETGSDLIAAHYLDAIGVAPSKLAQALNFLRSTDISLQDCLPGLTGALAQSLSTHPPDLVRIDQISHYARRLSHPTTIEAQQHRSERSKEDTKQQIPEPTLTSEQSKVYADLAKHSSIRNILVWGATDRANIPVIPAALTTEEGCVKAIKKVKGPQREAALTLWVALLELSWASVNDQGKFEQYKFIKVDENTKLLSNVKPRAVLQDLELALKGSISDIEFDSKNLTLHSSQFKGDSQPHTDLNNQLFEAHHKSLAASASTPLHRALLARSDVDPVNNRSTKKGSKKASPATRTQQQEPIGVNLKDLDDLPRLVADILPRASEVSLGLPSFFKDSSPNIVIHLPTASDDDPAALVFDEHDVIRDFKIEAIKDQSLQLALAEWGEQLLEERVPGLVQRMVKEAAAQQEFAEASQFVSWLEQKVKSWRSDPLLAGYLGRGDKVAELALSYCVAHPDSQHASEAIELLARAKYFEGFSYLSLKDDHGGISTASHSRYQGPDNDQRIAGLKIPRDKLTPLLPALRQFVPITHDAIVYPRLLEEKTISGPGIAGFKDQKLAELGSLIEPIFIGRGGLSNLHDLWALGAKQGKKSALRSELLRTKEESIDTFLSRLEKLPHKFSERVWSEIGVSAIREIADLKKTVAFINRTLTFSSGLTRDDSTQPEASENLPGLERIRVLSLIEVISSSISRFGSTQQNQLLDGNFDKLLNIVQEIPRTSRRNAAVLTLLETFKSTKSGISDDQLSVLVSLIETEPYEEMVHEVFENSVNHHSPELAQVEDVLVRTPSKFVPASALETSEAFDFAIGRSHLYGNPAPGNVELKLLPDAVLKHFGAEPIYAGDNDKSWITPDQLRIAALYSLKQKAGYQAPMVQLELISESIRAAESVGDFTFKRLKTPLADITDLNAGVLVLTRAFTCKTPLRDSKLKELELGLLNTGSALSVDDYRKLAALAFSPEVRQYFGVKAVDLHFAILRAKKVGAEALTAAKTEEQNFKALKILEELMPYPSPERNQKIFELRDIFSSYGEREARVMSALFSLPGLPSIIPSQDSDISSAYSSFLSELVKGFSDKEVVEIVLYLSKLLDKKPDIVEYLEHLNGQTFDALRNSVEQIPASARREMFHLIFGGRNGLFARADPQALKHLSNTIAATANTALKLSAETADLINQLVYSALVEGEFSVNIKVELLAAVAEWTTKNRSGNITIDEQKDLIMQICGVIPAGYRILQSFILEPGLFSAELKSALSEAQDRAGPALPCVPFHLAKYQGLSASRLGPNRGAGSVAEVHERRQSDQAEPTIMKFTRMDLMSSLTSIEKPLLRLAKLVSEAGYSWSEASVTALLDSCREETRELHKEATLTGPKMAEIMRQALGASSVTEVPEGCQFEVKFNASFGAESDVNRSVVVLLPRALNGDVPIKTEVSEQLVFEMTHLNGFMSFAEIERRALAKGQSLAQAVESLGINADEAATIVARLFLRTLLVPDSNDELALLPDLHRGNVGIIPGDEHRPARLAFLDFGGVLRPFPKEYRDWIIRFIGHAINYNLPELQVDLIDLAMYRVGEKGLDRELVTKLSKLTEESVAKAKEAIENGGDVFEVLREVLSFLYEKWPIPKEIHTLIEGCRRPAQQWVPLMSTQSLNSIQVELLSYLASQSSLTPAKSAARELVSKLNAQARKPADIYAEIKANLELPAWLQPKTKLGLADVTIFKIEEDDDGREVWRSYPASSDLKSGLTQIEYKDGTRKGTIPLKYGTTQGYICYSEGTNVSYASFEHLKSWSA